VGSATRFGDDLDFLQRHTETVVLSQGSTHVVVCPALQGRIATSTTGGTPNRASAGSTAG
jgi:hypothetical protein